MGKLDSGWLRVRSPTGTKGLNEQQQTKKIEYFVRKQSPNTIRYLDDDDYYGKYQINSNCIKAKTA